MEALIRKALDKAGYFDNEATEQNLINCFLDYVDSGVFKNLDYDDAKQDIEDGEITITDMCKNLIRYCR